MSRSARFIKRGVQGVLRENWFWGGVLDSYSVVQITAGEVEFGADDQPEGAEKGQNFNYHLGAASIWVSNVCPHKNTFNGQTGGVTFLLHVDWDSPLDVAVTVTVEDTVPEVLQGYV